MLNNPEIHPTKNELLLSIALTTYPLSSIDKSQITMAANQIDDDSTFSYEIIKTAITYPTALTHTPAAIDINVLYIVVNP